MLYGLFCCFLPVVLAGDEAEAGATVPGHMDGALAAGGKLAVVGNIHINQFHPSANGILLTQLRIMPESSSRFASASSMSASMKCVQDMVR